MPADERPEIADPKGYQEMLLSHLGNDDPAEAQSGTPAALRVLFEEGGSALRERPADGEWSALECAAHIFGAEIVYAGRYRWILAQDQPPLIGYDQDLWVTRLRADQEDAGALLQAFETLRRANIALWNRTDEAARARVGIHAERGPESLDLSFRLIAGHDRLHLEQARRALAAAG
jgi:hypothetical protein